MQEADGDKFVVIIELLAGHKDFQGIHHEFCCAAIDEIAIAIQRKKFKNWFCRSGHPLECIVFSTCWVVNERIKRSPSVV